MVATKRYPASKQFIGNSFRIVGLLFGIIICFYSVKSLYSDSILYKNAINASGKVVKCQGNYDIVVGFYDRQNNYFNAYDPNIQCNGNIVKPNIGDPVNLIYNSLNPKQIKILEINTQSLGQTVHISFAANNPISPDYLYVSFGIAIILASIFAPFFIKRKYLKK